MSEPYLSIIATSRNDDHGGSMLQRMQAFVEGLCGQAERWGLDAELILVELEPLVLDITGSLPLDFCDDSGNLLHRILLGGREKHFIPFGLAARSRVHLKVRDGSLPPGARDWLVLRIHAFHLEETPAATAAPKAVLLGKGWHQIEKEPVKPFFRWAEKECWLAGPASRPRPIWRVRWLWCNRQWFCRFG